jgi:hypothetical protein
MALHADAVTIRWPAWRRPRGMKRDKCSDGNTIRAPTFPTAQSASDTDPCRVAVDPPPRLSPPRSRGLGRQPRRVSDARSPALRASARGAACVSLRHNYKDALRDLGLKAETASYVMGHGYETVHEEYGSEGLRRNEI